MAKAKAKKKHPGGRPPRAGSAATAVSLVRLTDEESELLEEAAEASGEKIAQILRTGGLERARRILGSGS